MAQQTKNMKFKVGGSNPAAAEPGVTKYTGDVPKEGAYLHKLKRLLIKKNDKGESMISGLAEIEEPKGSAFAKYNGYGTWIQQNITDQGKGYVNQLLAALTDGSDEQMLEIKEAFWEEGPKCRLDPKPDKKGKEQWHIVKIGDFLINSPAPEIKDIYIIIAGDEENNSFGHKFKAVSYAPATAERIGGDSSSSKSDDPWGAAADDDGDDDGDDGDEAPSVTVEKTEKKAKKDKKAKKAKPAETDNDDNDDDDGEPPF